MTWERRKTKCQSGVAEPTTVHARPLPSGATDGGQEETHEDTTQQSSTRHTGCESARGMNGCVEVGQLRSIEIDPREVRLTIHVEQI